MGNYDPAGVKMSDSRIERFVRSIYRMGMRYAINTQHTTISEIIPSKMANVEHFEHFDAHLTY